MLPEPSPTLRSSYKQAALIKELKIDFGVLVILNLGVHFNDPDLDSLDWSGKKLLHMSKNISGKQKILCAK